MINSTTRALQNCRKIKIMKGMDHFGFWTRKKCINPLFVIPHLKACFFSFTIFLPIKSYLLINSNNFFLSMIALDTDDGAPAICLNCFVNQLGYLNVCLYICLYFRCPSLNKIFFTICHWEEEVNLLLSMLGALFGKL